MGGPGLIQIHSWPTHDSHNYDIESPSLLQSGHQVKQLLWMSRFRNSINSWPHTTLCVTRSLLSPARWQRAQETWVITAGCRMLDRFEDVFPALCILLSVPLTLPVLSADYCSPGCDQAPWFIPGPAWPHSMAQALPSDTVTRRGAQGPWHRPASSPIHH